MDICTCTYKYIYLYMYIYRAGNATNVNHICIYIFGMHWSGNFLLRPNMIFCSNC